MKLNEQIYAPALPAGILDFMRSVARKVNGLASGSVAAFDGLAAAAPTSGTWAWGDTLRNSAPAEVGTAGARYVVTGWICTAGGAPGTWREMRTLTGN